MPTAPHTAPSPGFPADYLCPPPSLGPCTVPGPPLTAKPAQLRSSPPGRPPSPPRHPRAVLLTGWDILPTEMGLPCRTPQQVSAPAGSAPSHLRDGLSPTAPAAGSALRGAGATTGRGSVPARVALDAGSRPRRAHGERALHPVESGLQTFPFWPRSPGAGAPRDWDPEGDRVGATAEGLLSGLGGPGPASGAGRRGPSASGSAGASRAPTGRGADAAAVTAARPPPRGAPSGLLARQGLGAPLTRRVDRRRRGHLLRGAGGGAEPSPGGAAGQAQAPPHKGRRGRRLRAPAAAARSRRRRAPPRPRARLPVSSRFSRRHAAGAPTRGSSVPAVAPRDLGPRAAGPPELRATGSREEQVRGRRGLGAGAGGAPRPRSRSLVHPQSAARVRGASRGALCPGQGPGRRGGGALGCRGSRAPRREQRRPGGPLGEPGGGSPAAPGMSQATGPSRATAPAASEPPAKPLAARGLGGDSAPPGCVVPVTGCHLRWLQEPQPDENVKSF